MESKHEHTPELKQIINELAITHDQPYWFLMEIFNMYYKDVALKSLVTKSTIKIVNFMEEDMKHTLNFLKFELK